MSDNSQDTKRGGRPPMYGDTMETASLRLPEEMKELLKRAGGKHGLSGAVRDLVEENLDTLDQWAEAEG